MDDLKVNILGAEWTISIVKPEKDDRLKDTDGFTDWTEKKIVIANLLNEGNLGCPSAYLFKVIRHEILHAFMRESGLGECMFESNDQEEIMIDWMAIQWNKMKDTIKDCEDRVFKELYD